MAEFKIIVQGYRTSVNEWDRARRAGKEELPKLTEEQKAFARKVGVSEEDYARKVLAGRYGSERLAAEAERFGRLVQEVLADFKSQQRAEIEITDVFYSAFDREFTCHFREGSKEFSCYVSSILVADHLDSGDVKLKERIKHLVTGKIEEARMRALGAAR